MFPPALPHYLIRWLSRPGDVVYDPFSGRGTALLEAGLLRRIPAGSDANPLAWILSSSKAKPPSLQLALERIEELGRVQPIRPHAPVADHVRNLFDGRVLSELLALRSALSHRRSVDRFLLGSLCGILHANARKDGTPRGLTVAMPNTFSMSPAYVARYVQAKQLKPPIVVVANALRERVTELLHPELGDFGGTAWYRDVRSEYWPRSLRRASLIVTSPPYLRVMKYGKMNWLRTWLIGADSRVIDRQLFASTSLARYIEFMKGVLPALRHKLRPDGRICLVIGDVRGGTGESNLAREVIRHCVPETDLRIQGVFADHLPVRHKVSRIWGELRGHATQTDRLIILGGPRAASLPDPPDVDWTRTTQEIAA
jgi:hypothetical protein